MKKEKPVGPLSEILEITSGGETLGINSVKLIKNDLGLRPMETDSNICGNIITLYITLEHLNKLAPLYRDNVLNILKKQQLNAFLDG